MAKIDTESVIAEVVNNTLPSNEQMKTVRILRKVLNEHNEKEKKVLNKYYIEPQRVEEMYGIKVKHPVTVTITSND